MVLGISRDTVKAQKKFKDKYGLPYDLLADPEMVLIKRYDLLKEKKMYGKPVTGVERTTYVIGPDTGKGQRLLHVFPKVTPAGHAEEVFALLKQSGREGLSGRSDCGGAVRRGGAGRWLSGGWGMRRSGRRRRSSGGR